MNLPIDIIVPVYRGLAQTRRCIESVLAAAGTAAREVVAIDDASPEPEIGTWLAELARSGRITLIRHEDNRGFVRSANEGMALHPDRDVVLLNSDTEVADGWLDRLAACARREPRVGSVTPFSNNATICSYPKFCVRNTLPEGLSTRELDRLFARANAGASAEIPTAVGFCMFIRRECLEAVGAFDEGAFGRGYGEEVDFCMRAARRGYRHLLCADTFVYHEGEVSFGDGAALRETAQRVVDERHPEFHGLVRDFVQRDPPRPFREAVTTLASFERRPALPAGVAAPDDGGPPTDAPFAAVLVVEPGEVDALQGSLRGLAGNCVLPGLHLCLAAPAQFPPAEQGALERLVAALPARLRCSVVRPRGTGTFRAALGEFAKRFPGEDLVIIAPGAELPFAWDARLRKAAYADRGIAGASPLCDASPLHALVDEDKRNDPALDRVRVDRTAFALGDRSFYEIPGLHPICAYLRRDALDAEFAQLGPDAAAPRDVLDALAALWRARGRSCVVCDFLYVGYRGAPGAAPRAPGLEETAYLQHHPLGGLRRAVNDAIARGLPPVSTPGLDHRPVRLHVMHFWGGGLERWVRDFGRAEPSAIHMILASYRIGETGGQRLVLYSDPAAMIPIRVWDIARPIRSTAAGSLEYRQILAQVLEEFDVETLIVSSLIGHALDALDTSCKTLVVCHDYYPVCQAINPQFGKTCERCTLEDLRQCARSNPLNSIFPGEPSEAWHAMRNRYAELLLGHRIEVVVPSRSVETTLKKLEPRLGGLAFHRIAHGIDFEVAKLPYPSRPAGEKLRVVVLGRLSLHKGLQLLRDAREELRNHAVVTLVGCGANGAKLAGECGWNFIERYEPDALAGILREISPHAGLLASVVPETFSYTLSELWALGIPPLATGLGSFPERIAEGEDGFLFAPESRALAELLARLRAQPARLETVARNLAARPGGRTAADMAADYRALVPVAPRPVARFRVGIGRQSALTEPYRHLTEAYAQLTEAYGRSAKAYEQTRAAYESSTGELRSLKDELAKWNLEFDALRARSRWWRAPEALLMVKRLRARIRLLGGDGHGAGGRDAREDPNPRTNEPESPSRD